MYKFYLPERTVNEATSYYISVLKRSIEKTGEKVSVVNKVSEISRSDKVLTVTAKHLLLVHLRNRRQFVFNWWQGIGPEELELNYYGKRYVYILKRISRFFEKYAIKHSRFNFFVSEAMREHFSHQYGYYGQNYYIMPCFNQELDISVFSSEKYLFPSFVYAGSMSRWQAIDKMLILYSRIKQCIPGAKLTILSREEERAKSICQNYNIAAEIKFIPLDELNNELKHYKYGFIVRDDIVVNNVATPTKMNSYMANGIIPVYSDVVYDYRKSLCNLKYAIPFTTEEECVKKIMHIEQVGVDCESMKAEFSTVFSTYWCPEKYIEEISSIVSSWK